MYSMFEKFHNKFLAKWNVVISLNVSLLYTKLKIYFTTEISVCVFVIHFRHSIPEIKMGEFPEPLKIKSSLSSGTSVCTSSKHELRHIQQDCHYITFSSVSTWYIMKKHVCWPHVSTAHINATHLVEQKERTSKSNYGKPIQQLVICNILFQEYEYLANAHTHTHTHTHTHIFIYMCVFFSI